MEVKSNEDILNDIMGLNEDQDKKKKHKNKKK